MTRIKYIILIFLPFISICVSGQTRDTTDWILPKKEFKDVGVICGIQQFNNSFFELGVSQTRQSRQGCFWSSYFYGSSLSAEFNPFQKKGGASVNLWTTLLILTVGANINSYTDFKKYDIGIRPFIGIGGILSLTYGYNFLFVNNKIGDINRHCITLRYHITIKERK